MRDSHPPSLRHTNLHCPQKLVTRTANQESELETQAIERRKPTQRHSEAYSASSSVQGFGRRRGTPSGLGGCQGNPCLRPHKAMLTTGSERPPYPAPRTTKPPPCGEGLGTIRLVRLSAPPPL